MSSGTGSCTSRSRGRLSFLGRRRMATSLGSWLSLAVIALFFSVAGAAPPIAADCPNGDGDGYVVCGGCEVPAGKLCGDCNDANSAVFPGALEVCNGIDDNCAGGIDEIPDTDPVDGVDNDDDGLTDEGIYFCVFNESSGP